MRVESQDRAYSVVPAPAGAQEQLFIPEESSG